MTGRPGDSVVIKACYDVASSAKWDRRIQYRVKSRMGWHAWVFDFPARANDPETYHCEITVPDGIDIVNEEVATVPDKPAFVTFSPPNNESDLCVQTKSVNLDVTSYRCTVRVWLRAAATGWLAEAMYSGLAIVLTMWFIALASARLTRPDDGTHPHTDDIMLAGTVLLALAAALIALLSRNEEHRLKSKMLSGVRIAVAAMVVLQFAAVLVLILGRKQDLLLWWFVWLGVVEFLLLLVVFFAWTGLAVEHHRHHSQQQ